MCTVTWLHQPGGYQVFFNRDELRSRQPGLPPSAASQTGVKYLAPTDADAGGTWIAANEFGLTVCLLNLYLEDRPQPPGHYQSRGHLVRQLAGLTTLEEISTDLRDRDKTVLRSFSLLGFGTGRAVGLWQWDGQSLSASVPDTMPISSSSFETARAIASRQQVWRQQRPEGVARTAADHLAFHRCELPEPGPFAPAMSRPDARTVSLTQVVVNATEVALLYAAGPPATTELGAPLSLARTLQLARTHRPRG